MRQIKAFLPGLGDLGILSGEINGVCAIDPADEVLRETLERIADAYTDESILTDFAGEDGTAAQGLLARGHSKDNRPEAVQFKNGLATLDPAGVPLLTDTVAGQVADDPLYVPAWRRIMKSRFPCRSLITELVIMLPKVELSQITAE